MGGDEGQVSTATTQVISMNNGSVSRCIQAAPNRGPRFELDKKLLKTE